MSNSLTRCAYNFVGFLLFFGNLCNGFRLRTSGVRLRASSPATAAGLAPAPAPMALPNYSWARLFDSQRPLPPRAWRSPAEDHRWPAERIEWREKTIGKTADYHAALKEMSARDDHPDSFYWKNMSNLSAPKPDTSVFWDTICRASNRSATEVVEPPDLLSLSADLLRSWSSSCGRSCRPENYVGDIYNNTEDLLNACDSECGAVVNLGGKSEEYRICSSAGFQNPFTGEHELEFVDSLFDGWQGNRNDRAGEVGVSFVPEKQLSVNYLGRRIAAGEESLIEAVNVTLWSAEDQSILARLVVGHSSHKYNHYAYEVVSPPVLLEPGKEYRLTQTCFLGMRDLWFDGPADAHVAAERTLNSELRDGVSSTQPGQYPATIDGALRYAGMLNFKEGPIGYDPEDCMILRPNTFQGLDKLTETLNPKDPEFWAAFCAQRYVPFSMLIKNKICTSGKILPSAPTEVGCAELTADDEECGKIFDFVEGDVEQGTMPVCRCQTTDETICEATEHMWGNVWTLDYQ